MMIQTGTAQAYRHIINDDQEEGENLLRKSLTMDAAAREVENEISTAMGNSNAKAGVNLHVSAS